MVYEGICMVWYMNSNVMMCGHESPRGVVLFTYESGLDLRHFLNWRWRLMRLIPFTLRDATLVPEYWSLKMRKHFRTFMWNELINLPFPRSFQWFFGQLTLQPGASSCWGSELGWLEEGQFSQGKRPSSRKWYLEKMWSYRMIDVTQKYVTQKSYHWIPTSFRGFLVFAKITNVAIQR